MSVDTPKFKFNANLIVNGRCIYLPATCDASMRVKLPQLQRLIKTNLNMLCCAILRKNDCQCSSIIIKEKRESLNKSASFYYYLKIGCFVLFSKCAGNVIYLRSRNVVHYKLMFCIENTLDQCTWVVPATVD